MGLAGSKDWYLQEWAALKGKRQADLMRERGWSKARASKVWTGAQAWSRDDVHELAEWLQISPHELLMAPADAVALRNLRDSALQIATGGTPPATAPKSGTHG